MKRICFVAAGVIAGLLFAGPVQAHIIDEVPSSTGPATVQVSQGATLSSIATLMDTTWWSLASYNHISDPNMIFPGQSLTMPPPGYVPPPMPAPQVPSVVVVLASTAAPRAAPTSYTRAGYYSFSALESLWVQAGGPSAVEHKAAQIAMCESGGNPNAYNRSGATGLWQILGGTGNLYDPYNNAVNAVRKYHGRNNTFAAWVCQ